MTAKELQKQIEKRFLGSNIETSEAEWIVLDVCGLSRTGLATHEVSKKEEKKIQKIVELRMKSVPLAQIFHKRNFFGFDFYITKDVLIPRFETEGLCELVSKVLPTKTGDKMTGLDLGTGSGAIAIVLSKMFGYQMTAVDISKKALAVAKKNAKKIGADVRFLRSNMTDEVLGERFDFVVSNPPYILTSDLAKLESQVVLHEPRLALDGGGDGLQFYRKIVHDAPYVLEEDGYLFFEVGKGLAKEVVRLMERDFVNIEVQKDLQNIDRYVYGKLKKQRELK